MSPSSLTLMMMQHFVMRATTFAIVLSTARGLVLFNEDPHVKVLDKAGVSSLVLSAATPVLFGAFSDNEEECESCASVAAEFKKAAAYLADYGVLTVMDLL